MLRRPYSNATIGHTPEVKHMHNQEQTKNLRCYDHASVYIVQKHDVFLTILCFKEKMQLMCFFDCCTLGTECDNKSFSTSQATGNDAQELGRPR